jgi:uncharacterized protein (DUF1501 family)
MISRRDFLQISARSTAMLAGGAGLLHLGRINALAQTTSGYRAMVCVFLNGGNDGNNTIVPMATAAYQGYASARAGLALPQSGLLPVTTPSGVVYGLHPKLDGLRRLFEQQRVAVVANVGTLVRPLSREEYRLNTAPLPRNLFSHLDQQLAWQTAVPSGSVNTGWAGRVADRLSPSGPLAFPSVVSVAGSAVFANGVTSMPATIIPGVALGLARPDTSAGSAARLQSFQELLALDGGAILVHAANERTSDGVRQAGLLNTALAARGTLSTVFPQTDLGQQLYEVAKVIQVRQQLGVSRQIFYCSLSGFDTHSGQLSAQENALSQLGQALAAFHDATLEIGVDRQVTTFTESEFGRTLQPTSGTGSDHAWGSHQLVMGGAVRGGDIYGEFPTLALGGPDDVSGRGVWLPSSSLDQYGATLASWFGVPSSDMPLVFPNIGNFPTTNLGFLEA